MSRLCRLRNKSHGEDGQWAYEEITKLREQVKAQAAVIEALKSAIDHLWNGCENLHDNALDAYDKGYTRAMADSCKAALAIPTDSTQILDEVRKQERERVAQMILNGRFLHDESPAAQFAKEVAVAIRAMED